ncbi:MAG: polysaccharide deacetylase family protein [Acidimicrobiales bacterium]
MERPVSRRGFLAGAAALGVAACTDGGSTTSGSTTSGSTTSGSSSAGSAPTIAAPSTATTSSAAVPGAPARFVNAGTPGRNQMALTFHTSGDPALFHQLADLFAARKVLLTAFIVGQWLDDNPELGRVLHAAGHELANHTYTHPPFAALTPDKMTDEIARCRAAVAKVAPGGGAYFRLSGTSDGTSTPPAAILALAGAGGYPTVLGFDLDPLDFEDPGADAVAQRTIDGLHDGAIVSLHFGHAGTVAALPRILDAIAARGLTPVTVSTLLT